MVKMGRNGSHFGKKWLPLVLYYILYINNYSKWIPRPKNLGIAIKITTVWPL